MAMKQHGRIRIEANAPGMTVTLPLQGKSSPFSDGTKIRPTRRRQSKFRNATVGSQLGVSRSPVQSAGHEPLRRTCAKEHHDNRER